MGSGAKSVRGGWLLAAVLLTLGSSGCGGGLYSIYATSATSRFEEAKAVHAAEHAPYVYYLAEEHMRKASEEASRAEYGDALHLIKLADQYAEQAIESARAARSASTAPR